MPATVDNGESRSDVVDILRTLVSGTARPILEQRTKSKDSFGKGSRCRLGRKKVEPTVPSRRESKHAQVALLPTYAFLETWKLQ